MTAKLETGTLEPREPRFVDGEFRQSFQFRTTVKISRNGARQITESVMAQFKRTLEMNKIERYSWPPRRIELTPHADFMGFECEVGTLAQEPGFTVIHAIN